MHAFSNLVQSLKETTSISKKINLLTVFFKSTSTQDLIWVLALLYGKRPKGIVPTSKLKEWVAEEANIPMWLFSESYYIVGDLAETCAMLAHSKDKSMYIGSLADVMNQLLLLKSKTIEEKKEYVVSFWRLYDASSVFVFNKLLTGGFRMGVSEGIVAKAIAAYTHREVSDILVCLSGDWDPQKIDFTTLLERDIKSDSSRPYPFCLATTFDKDLQSRLDLDGLVFERKLDGMRGQIIKRENQVFIWSRGEELVNTIFPDLKEAAMDWPNGMVVDGEVLVWNNQESCFADFSLLQKRMNRKKPSASLIKQLPVVFVAFDIMEYQGEILTSLPFWERRNYLELVATSWNKAVFSIAAVNTFKEWGQVYAQRDNGMVDEGWMIKNKEGMYEAGRKAGIWWKWKKDPMVLDCVLLYAQKGHGRRANQYSDFTFAIRHNEKLLPIAKAYSGLTKEEIKEVSSFVQRHTLQQFGPVKTVEPILVFEIAFEAIHKSSRHKSGISVRFPRIQRWRKDKTVKDINTLEDAFALLKQ
jgi:DNA ligase-1